MKFNRKEAVTVSNPPNERPIWDEFPDEDAWIPAEDASPAPESEPEPDPYSEMQGM